MSVRTCKRTPLTLALTLAFPLAAQAQSAQDRLHSKDPDSIPTRAEFDARIKPASEVLDSVHGPHVVRVHPEASLCRNGLCRAIIASLPLYFDAHHLSMAGARLVADDIATAIAAAGDGGGDAAPTDAPAAR